MKLCEWCQHPLTDAAAKAGHRYCDPPVDGESCGRQAALATTRAARRKTIEEGIPTPHIVEHHVRM